MLKLPSKPHYLVVAGKPTPLDSFEAIVRDCAGIAANVHFQDLGPPLASHYRERIMLEVLARYGLRK